MKLNDTQPWNRTTMPRGNRRRHPVRVAPPRPARARVAAAPRRQHPELRAMRDGFCLLCGPVITRAQRALRWLSRERWAALAVVLATIGVVELVNAIGVGR